jgi:hypothetical protein
MAKPLIKNLHNLSDEQYQQHIELHKGMVSEMIIGYLFPPALKTIKK